MGKTFERALENERREGREEERLRRLRSLLSSMPEMTPEDALAALKLERREWDRYLALLGQGPVVEAAVEYIRELFAGNVDGHGAEHALRVYRCALELAGDYPDCDLQVLSLASLLHDTDDHKLFATKNNANARRFLQGQGLDTETIGHICTAINEVSYSQNQGRPASTIEGKLVQDADRLDAIGAVGIARAFAYGGRHGQTLEQSRAHFEEKLLLLSGRMNTPRAREMAEERHAFMVAFLEKLDEEMKWQKGTVCEAKE